MLFRSWLLTLILQAKVTASSMDRRRPGVTSHEVLQLTLKHVPETSETEAMALDMFYGVPMKTANL